MDSCKEIGEGGDWLHLACDRCQSQAVVNTGETLDSIKGWIFLE